MHAFDQHVFISFAHVDLHLAMKVVEHLEFEGIPVWIDDRELSAGSPDRDKEIRENIDRSFVVCLIATPNSGRSQFVKGELLIAEDKQKKIIPCWLAGDTWSECAPINLLHTQHIDLRGPRAAGINELTAAINNIRESQFDAIQEVRPLYRTTTRSRFLRFLRPRRFQDHLLLDFSRLGMSIDYYNLDQKLTIQDRWNFGMMVGDGLLETLADLLDEIYMNYLFDTFPSHTYGSRWLLVATGDTLNKIAGATELFWKPEAGVQQATGQKWREWTQNISRSDLLMESGTRWEVRPTTDIVFMIFATTTAERLALLCENNGKFVLHGLERGKIKLTRVDSIPDTHSYCAMLDASILRRPAFQRYNLKLDGPIALVDPNV